MAFAKCSGLACARCVLVGDILHACGTENADARAPRINLCVFAEDISLLPALEVPTDAGKGDKASKALLEQGMPGRFFNKCVERRSPGIS